MWSKFFHIFRQRKVNAAYYRSVGILLLFVAVGAVWVLLSGVRLLSPSGGIYDEGAGTSNVNMRIRGDAFVQFDFNTKPARAFKGSVLEDMTVAEALEQAAFAGNISLSWRPVPTIDGIADGTDGKYWAFYRNDKKLTEPISSISVEPGDELFARFE